MREVACAFLLRDDHVLLGRRMPQRRSYPGCWDVLGGHLEAGETPEQALIREVQEEAGVTPIRYHRIGSFTDPDPARIDKAICHCFAVTAWAGGAPAMLGDEHSEIRWFSLIEAAELPGLALEDYRALFWSLAAH